jgi:hypothetical protein
MANVNEKQDQMFNRWLSAEGIDFINDEAERAYKARITRIKDAIQLKKNPDRVPICPIISFFPTYYSGFKPEETMHDYSKAAEAARKFVNDFQPDTSPGIIFAGSAPLFEILDYKQYAWPGHGVPPEHPYQCIEAEYMKPDEYDAFIQDPSHYYLSTLFPRTCGALKGLKNVMSPAMVRENLYGAFVLPFANPEVQESYKTLFKAGEEAAKWMGRVGQFDVEMAAAGYPNMAGGFTKAPFDVLGDILRGTKGVMRDLYKRPEKLKKAMETITPFLIQGGIGMAMQSGNPIVFMPLHKGADGFLSDEQFKEFYWPGFKKVMMGLINAGCVPYPFVEGGYNTRLEVIKDIPKGTTGWTFDQTDMKKAKEILGDVACIGGNISSSLLATGTPEKVKERCRYLIDTCGSDGGYIMANGAALDHAKPENLKTMIDFTKEYGKYD